MCRKSFCHGVTSCVPLHCIVFSKRLEARLSCSSCVSEFPFNKNNGTQGIPTNHPTVVTVGTSPENPDDFHISDSHNYQALNVDESTVEWWQSEAPVMHNVCVCSFKWQDECYNYDNVCRRRLPRYSAFAGANEKWFISGVQCDKAWNDTVFEITCDKLARVIGGPGPLWVTSGVEVPSLARA